MGRYVYMHRGNGFTVDNIMKPLKAIGKRVKAAAAPFLKKTVKKGATKAGEKLARMASEKMAEKSGDLIRKRLNGVTKGYSSNRQMSGVTEKGPPKRKGKTQNKKSQQDVNALINNLIAKS